MYTSCALSCKNPVKLNKREPYQFIVKFSEALFSRISLELFFLFTCIQRKSEHIGVTCCFVFSCIGGNLHQNCNNSQSLLKLSLTKKSCRFQCLSTPFPFQSYLTKLDLRNLKIYIYFVFIISNL